jgi:hypothetical protein
LVRAAVERCQAADAKFQYGHLFPDDLDDVADNMDDLVAGCAQMCPQRKQASVEYNPDLLVYRYSVVELPGIEPE